MTFLHLHLQWQEKIVTNYITSANDYDSYDSGDRIFKKLFQQFTRTNTKINHLILAELQNFHIDVYKMKLNETKRRIITMNKQMKVSNFSRVKLKVCMIIGNIRYTCVTFGSFSQQVVDILVEKQKKKQLRVAHESCLAADYSLVAFNE